MYIFNLDHAAKVKIADEGWENPKMREVLYQYVITIRMMMGFRSFVCLWAIYLEEGTMKNYFCAIQFYFDLYIVTIMFLENFVRPTHKVLLHRDIKVPLSLQTSLVVSGIYCFLKAQNYI